MFKSYCSTMYCSSMRFDSTVTSMTKLKIAYNNSLRRILNLSKYNSASEMFVILNCEICSDLPTSYYKNLSLVLRVEFKTLISLLVNGIVKSLCHYLVKNWPGAMIFSTHNTCSITGRGVCVNM